LDFVVPTGTGYFDFWATLGQPPAAEYPTFVRKNGDTLAGDLDFAGNEIQGARIGPSNVIQSPVLSDRPVGLEPGQVAYSADGGIYWLGIGTSESYGVDGSQVIPSPPAGKGWREFSSMSAPSTDGPASPSALPLSIITSSGILSPNREYWANSLSLLSLQLPLSAQPRERLIVRGLEGTKWRVTQDTGQSIQFGNKKTTAGASGRIESLEDDSMIELIYRSNGLWFASHFAGNFEVL
jgi:hypothetical protein